MAITAIGIGSNLGDSIARVRDAVAALAAVGEVTAVSSLYRSKPWGVADQPDFINAAALLSTELSPRELLVELKKIERRLGREPGYRWGPRAIDLDIVYYDDVEIDEPDLRIPHAHFLDRAFVLIPLAEIDPRYASKIRPEHRSMVSALDE